MWRTRHRNGCVHIHGGDAAHKQDHQSILYGTYPDGHVPLVLYQTLRNKMLRNVLHFGIPPVIHVIVAVCVMWSRRKQDVCGKLPLVMPPCAHRPASK